MDLRSPNESARVARKNRTNFVRLIAHRDDVVEPLSDVFVEHLRALSGNIDAELAHRLDGERMNARHFGTSAEHLELVASILTQQTLGHLAAG